MNIHKITIATTAIIFTAFTFGAAAQAGGNDNAGRTGQGKGQHSDRPGAHQTGDSRMQGRDNADRRNGVDRGQGNRQGNENSNRQSDPDSTRGLERAEERRSANADHQGQADKESHWYDFMFGKNKKMEGDMERNHETAEKKQRWWWPFN
ncbi:MAG: hypothetical protein WD750_05525 [Gammaproteobacteria bacterium]